MVIHHQIQRPDLQIPLDLAHVYDEDRYPLRLVFHVAVRRGSRQQKHQIGLFRPRDEDLLPVDYVTVSLADRAGLDPCGL